MQLQGFVAYTGTPPVILWKLYSGPGTANFNNPAQTNSTVTFNSPGVYTLMLSADDGVHAVAYDAVNLTVTQTITLAIAPVGNSVQLSWAGGSPPAHCRAFRCNPSDFVDPSNYQQRSQRCFALSRLGWILPRSGQLIKLHMPSLLSSASSAAWNCCTSAAGGR